MHMPAAFPTTKPRRHADSRRVTSASLISMMSIARFPFVWAAGAGVVLGGTGGCTGGINRSDHLLGGEPLPALVVVPPGLGGSADGPSLRHEQNGWDRRHWDPVVVSVPRGQTETNPSGAGWLQLDRSLSRQRGEFPVDAEVLDGAGDPGIAALEGALNIAAGPGLLFVGPLIDAFAGRWPWTVVNMPPSEPDSDDRASSTTVPPWEAASRYQRVPPASPYSPWPWLGIDDAQSASHSPLGQPSATEP